MAQNYTLYNLNILAIEPFNLSKGKLTFIRPFQVIPFHLERSWKGNCRKRVTAYL